MTRQTAEEAIPAFVAREQQAMLRLATLLVGSKESAEDIVQDALVTLTARWHDIENPGGYLRITVVNGCRMHLRRRDAGRRALRALGLPLPAEAPSELFELRDSLNALSDRQRIVLVMRYLVDADDDEIAVAIGCSRATVRSLARRGLREMRRTIS